MPRSCDRCEAPLETDDEIADRLCGACGDALYTAFQEREDFARFHPGSQAQAEDTQHPQDATTTTRTGQ